MTAAASTEVIRETVKAHVARGEIDAALRLIHRVVDHVFCEPINTAQIFGSHLLDDLCQEIGAVSWRKIRNSESRSTCVDEHTHSEECIVYIVSRLYPSGGHTSVLADIIRLSPPARSHILITGMVGQTAPDVIQTRFRSMQDVVFENAPRGTHADRLYWLQRRLNALAPTDVWLFNHHQDSVAVAAVQPSAGYRLRYCHHGDHHLCLGVLLPYADHIDLHPMGFHYCRNELSIRNNRYLPLVVRDQGDRPASHMFKDGTGLITCTAGNSNKIDVPYFIRYADVIPGLLRESKGRHIHIGHLNTATLLRIRHGMRKLNIPASAFVHVPYVSSVWKALHEYEVDLYVASFPYGGGRTLIEAMGAGIPVAVHSHCSSRLLGASDLAYDGALIWRTPRELYEHIRNIRASALNEQSRLARNQYEEFHSDDVLRNALAHCAAPLSAPELSEDYMPDPLQRALDISMQVTYAGALRRTFTRLVRSLKWRLPASGNR